MLDRMLVDNKLQGITANDVGPGIRFRRLRLWFFRIGGRRAARQ